MTIAIAYKDNDCSSNITLYRTNLNESKNITPEKTNERQHKKTACTRRSRRASLVCLILFVLSGNMMHKALTAGIKDLDASVGEATENRKEENADYKDAHGLY